MFFPHHFQQSQLRLILFLFHHIYKFCEYKKSAGEVTSPTVLTKIFIRQVPITRGKEGYCLVILFFLLTLIGVLFGKAML